MDGGFEANGGFKQEQSQCAAPSGSPAPDIIYKPKRRKKAWIWITAAALILCAAAAVALFVLQGALVFREIKGNAGVVALYDFAIEQGKAQYGLNTGLMKEISGRISSEPFEINSQMKIEADKLVGTMIDNITVGFDAKYDMKDFGVKVNALGIDVLGAYVIGNDLVVDSMGKAGSLKFNGEGLDRSMPLGKRIKAILSFLPDDANIFIDLAEKAAIAVPDEYTSTDKEQVYSPKEDKKVLMNVTSITLDAEAVKKVIGNFREGLEKDKALSRKIQNMVDDFTEFAGMGPAKLSSWMDELGKLTKSEDIKDANVKISVYQRQGKYAGVYISFSSGDTKAEITYMNEYDGNELYSNTAYNINGVRQETLYHYTYLGNRVKLSGTMTQTQGEGLSSTMATIEGTIEYAKSGANEYKLTGEISVNGDIQSDLQDIGNSLSFTMGIDADIKVGGGLGTLKDDVRWNGVYDEKWGSIEEMFGGLFRGYNSFFPNFSSQA
jgi:hypothetical protein